jgi:hypothetical protein
MKKRELLEQFDTLQINPSMFGRFSMTCDDNLVIIGITDHYLNNGFSEEFFNKHIGTFYTLDEWKDVAHHMNINVENVPVYDVYHNLTDRKYSDYIQGEGQGDFLCDEDFDTDEEIDTL